jgi:oligopeptide transport system substrate-binding protein
VRHAGSIGRLAAGALCVSLLAAACGSSDKKDNVGGQTNTTANASGKTGGVFRIAIGEPSAIDPYNTRESEGTNVNKRLFVGLVTYDGNSELKMRPGVAEKWSFNTDCTQWTFNLRKGSKFTNGEEVTAKSFIDGWTRAVIGTAASQVAYHLTDVQGYKELHATPPTATTFSGLSAPDPYTFVVKLTASDCEFDKKTGTPVTSPVPSTAGDAKNQAFNEAPVGNGPFMIKPGTKWEHNQKISLVRNDGYFGDKPKLDGIDYTIFPAQGRLDAEYRAFTAGDVDFARIPAALFSQAKSTYEPQGNFFKQEMFGINYIMPNAAKGPLANADARKAVSMAIDRDAISKGVYQGSLTSATAFIPPPFGDFYSASVCADTCKYDPIKAKDFATKGGLTPGTHLKLSYNNDGGHEPLVQAWKDQLEKNLGVVVDLDGKPFAEQLQQRDKGDFDLARAAWSADYPTPDNFLFPLLGTGAEDNDGGYSNKAFDALITKERSPVSDSDRKKAIQDAEKLAVGTDMAAIPTYNRTQYRVFDSKKWTGVKLDFFEEPTLDLVGLK